MTPTNAFIDHAAKKYGAKRFVFFTGSTAEKGGPVVGKVWEHLDQSGVDYCVLRATWLMGTADAISVREDIVTDKQQKTWRNGNTTNQSRMKARSILDAVMGKSHSLVPMTSRLWHIMLSLMRRYQPRLCGF